MSALHAAEVTVGMLSTKDSLQEKEMGQKLQGKCFRIVSSVSPVKLYCCYVVITILIVAVTVLAAALSRQRRETVPVKNIYPACPTDWIGFRSKCYYFSENTSNWTHGQTFCKEQGAELARFDSMDELNFLNRYKGNYDYWISLYRESSEQPWRWTDNTEYNGLVSIRGEGERAYLNNNGISSARVYADRRWICSRLNSYSLECKMPFSSF